MPSIMCAALSAGIAVGGSSGVLAQRVGVDTYADEPCCEHSYQETGITRLQLLLPSDKDRRDVMPTRRADCGVFGYWNGERCVDARELPPDGR